MGVGGKARMGTVSSLSLSSPARNPKRAEGNFAIGRRDAKLKQDDVENADSNSTRYECKTIECACVPGRFLCGEDGSVNIDDFLVEEVVGPASFQCNTGKGKGGCSFEEPAMNNLINDIFGDKSITLDCESGECMREENVPGYKGPPRGGEGKSNVWMALSAALAAVVFFVACLGKSDCSRYSVT